MKIKQLTAILLCSGLAQSNFAADSMFIDANGNVGIGTNTPTSQVEVVGNSDQTGTNNTTAIYVKNTSTTAGGRVLFGIENKGTARFSIENTNAARWVFSAANDQSFRVSRADTAVSEFMVDAYGNVLAQGTFQTISDRNAKTNIMPLDSKEALEKVISLPIARWSYKKEQNISHIGPMAQDFYSAFGTGNSNKRIAIIDLAGASLAAIQGLNEKLEEKEARINQLEAKLEKLQSLQSRLEVLEKVSARLIQRERQYKVSYYH